MYHHMEERTAKHLTIAYKNSDSSFAATLLLVTNTVKCIYVYMYESAAAKTFKNKTQHTRIETNWLSKHARYLKIAKLYCL